MGWCSKVSTLRFSEETWVQFPSPPLTFIIFYDRRYKVNTITRDTIFSLETENVSKGVYGHRKQLLRVLNNALLKGEQPVLITLTFSYVLLFAAWSEAQFMQVIHTPDTLSDSQVNSIKDAKNRLGMGEGWKALIKCAFAKVPGDDVQVREKEARLIKVIEECIIPNSLLRNKIAHGQWSVALNREHTAQNADLTNQLNELDYVKIDLLFQIQQVIGFIVRDLLQSPDRGHFRFFWQHDTKLQELLSKRSSWNIDSKLATLRNRKKNVSCVKNGK